MSRDGLELAAVVDREIERAEFVAGEAEEILGTRPGCFTSLDDAIEATPDLEVIDVVVAAAAHHVVVETATAAGLHVLCEKPMAPGVRACRAMQSAAERNGRVLSVAENYRRDPIARLLRAVLDAGGIGELADGGGLCGRRTVGQRLQRVVGSSNGCRADRCLESGGA